MFSDQSLYDCLLNLGEVTGNDVESGFLPSGEKVSWVLGLGEM